MDYVFVRMFRDVASIVAEKAVNTETHRPFSVLHSSHESKY
jgi:hypothetical protein